MVHKVSLYHNPPPPSLFESQSLIPYNTATIANTYKTITAVECTVYKYNLVFQILSDDSMILFDAAVELL